MLYTPGHGGAETLWTMTRHEPESGLVEYLRVTPGSRMGTVRVQCAQPTAGTRVSVTYALTGSLSRLPSGSDTDDAATDWAFTRRPTPGDMNLAG